MCSGRVLTRGKCWRTKDASLRNRSASCAGSFNRCSDASAIFVSKYGSLINASRDGQLAMKALLQAHLKRIARDERGVAIRLFPFTRRRDAGTTLDALRLIAIDPAVAFGRPVIVGSRVPTSEIAERFQAGESPSELAEDFGRTEEEVWEAIRCEFPTAA